jgi:hypothetical protein
MTVTGSPERQSTPFREIKADSAKRYCMSADKRGSRGVGVGVGEVVGVDQLERSARRAVKRGLERSDDRRYSKVLVDLKVGNGPGLLGPKRSTEDPDPDLEPPLSPLRDNHTVSRSTGGSWTYPSDITKQLAESAEPLALIYQVALYSPLLHPSHLSSVIYPSLLVISVLCSTILYSTLPCSTLLYPTLLYSTLLYSTLLYSTLLYSTLLYFTLLYPTLLYFTLLYFTLLFFTLLILIY